MTLQAMVKHIELWLIDRLIPFARNPRRQSDAQIAQIAARIAEFGFNNPILVDTKAGIIAGHGRLLAARKLRLTEVPVIVLDGGNKEAFGFIDLMRIDPVARLVRQVSFEAICQSLIN